MLRRSDPPRVLRLNEIYEEQGGVRAYVLQRYHKGHSVAKIAADLSTALDERIPEDTLYPWLRKWEKEKQQQQQPEREEVTIST